MNNRKLVVNQLVYDNGKYEIDFEDFEKKSLKTKLKYLFYAARTTQSAEYGLRRN